jgi:hypothetical protein
LQQVRQVVSLSKFDLFCLTETWLNESFYSHELFDDSFIVLRRDRTSATFHGSGEDPRGGGVLIAFKKSPGLNLFHQVSLQSGYIEDIWITIVPLKGRTLHVCCSYIPGVTPASDFSSYFESLTDKILTFPNDEFIILGDQNVPEFVRDSLPRGSKYGALMDFMDLCDLTQYNNHINEASETVLDLVFSTSQLSIDRCDTALVTPDIYHPPLVISKHFSLPATVDEIKVFRNWKQANWRGIHDSLAVVDWDAAFFSCSDVDSLVDRFYDILMFSLNAFCPLIVKKFRSSFSRTSPETKRLLRKKRKANSSWKKFGNPVDLAIFEDLKVRCEESAANDERQAMEQAEENLSRNPRKFYQFVNKRRSNGAGVADFVSLDSVMATNKLDSANLFATYFGSTFSSAPSRQFRVPENLPWIGDWSSLEFSGEQVFDKLKNLNVNKCAGPDGFPPEFFKRCADILCYPLMLIFNASLDHGYMPQKWKEAHVTPIHKSGSQNDVRNFRPISKLSIIAKVLDSLVADELFERFKSIINTNQHGFYRRRSTVTNLLGYTEKLQQCINSGGQVDVVYTDFAKAFDTVSHDVLLAKLRGHGISGNLYSWFDSYLKGRSLRVQICGTLSDPVSVTSSVVQGSHCGPILFSIFINDISDILDVDFNCFADDLKLFQSIDSLEDSVRLQNNLDRLSVFVKENGLSLNVKKCLVSSYTRRRSRFVDANYSIDGQVLERKDGIKDLGVVFDRTCSFNSHIDNVCSRARKVIGFILRNSVGFKNPKTVVTLYSSLARSLLEYASQIWSPVAKTRVAQLESVQHRFLRSVAYRFFDDNSFNVEYSYYERKLNLHPLELRRVIGDVNFVTNSFSGRIDNSTFLHYFCFSVPRLASRTHRVFKPSLSQSVVSRLMSLFNLYCNNVDILSSVSCPRCTKAQIESKFIILSLNTGA